jgi:SAM-dependent methyltransferase
MTALSLQRTCPICDHPRGVFLHHQVFALAGNHPLAAGYDVVACEHCGFSFADTAATQADYDRFYATESKYADSATSTGAGLAPWDAERLRHLAAEIAAFASDRSQRIVDIGCANGGLLAELGKTGFRNLCGVDPAPACARETARLAGVEAFAGSLFDLPEGVGTCDGAVLSHVFEHVRDLRPALASVRARLSAAGWLYVEVPDATRYAEFLFAPFQDFNTEHINHFSLASLANLLRQGGFEPAHSGAKLIHSSANMPYPAAFIFARKTDAPGPLVRDEDTTARLREYIAASQELMRRLDARIREILAGAPRLLVWGAGQLTLKLLGETALKDATIAAFLDGNPVHQGRELHGAPVLAPRDLADHTTPILVASIINQASIIETIAQLGLRNPVRTLVETPAPFPR